MEGSSVKKYLIHTLKLVLDAAKVSERGSFRRLIFM